MNHEHMEKKRILEESIRKRDTHLRRKVNLKDITHAHECSINKGI